jgi:hypothetical protein
MWNMDLSTRSWHWWFWLFFIDNHENPSRPKQFMVIWSTKDVEKIKINSYLWHKERDAVKRGNRIDFHGLIGTWYYDGKVMKEPYFMDERDFFVEDNNGPGVLKTIDDDSQVFVGNPNRYKLHLTKDDIDVNLDMVSTNHSLSDHRVTYNNFFKGYGYEILKIHKMNLEGYFDDRGKKEDVTGTVYFQKVRINSPLVPGWYWGTVHMYDGSYLQYFMPHVGQQMLRRKHSQISPLDRGERYLSKRVNFYDKGEDRTYDFKNARISKYFNSKGMPVFTLKANNGREKLDFTLDCYSRACWYFEQPLLKVIRTFLYYNEYPAMLTRFSLEGNGKRITVKDLQGGVANCEHTWGSIL